jgi:hypothetical protein
MASINLTGGKTVNIGPNKAKVHWLLSAGGATWYVRPSGSTYGTGDGTSYENAFDDLETAVDFANTDSAFRAGDSLLLAEEGTYVVANAIEVTKAMTIMGLGDGCLLQADEVDKIYGFNTGMLYTNIPSVHFMNFKEDGRLQTGLPYVNGSDSNYPGRSSGVMLLAGCAGNTLTNITAINMTRCAFHLMGTNITATGLYGDNCMSATLKIGGIFDIPGFTKTSAINIRVTGGSVMSNYFGVSNGKD